MKRAYFLRGLRTRTMFCLEKIAGKAWLEITLIEKAKPEILPWDSAHIVAEKFKAELKADVFVEPASEVGRHHQLTAAPETRDPFSGRQGANEGNNAFGFQDPFAGIWCHRNAGHAKYRWAAECSWYAEYPGSAQWLSLRLGRQSK
jgi:hypothetical protein